MEVVLRKTKINKALLKQIDFYEFDDIINYSPIGWCRVTKDRKKNVDYCILQNVDTQDLKKMLLIDFVSFPDVNAIEINYHVSHTPVKRLELGDSFMCTHIFNNLQRIKRETKEKGQFYL